MAMMTVSEQAKPALCWPLHGTGLTTAMISLLNVHPAGKIRKLRILFSKN